MDGAHMAYDATQTLFDAVRLAVLPGIGFLAGFGAQWLLQERKSRDELVRALAEQRAQALRKLWEITTLPAEISTLAAGTVVSEDLREPLDRLILDWYTKQAGALFLSWHSTQLLFGLLDQLRSDQTRKGELEKAVSSLRSRLKRDCGIYTASEARHELTRPRPALWTNAAAMEQDRSDKTG